MAVKAVAVKGDVSATPGVAMYTGATAGAWTAGPITETSYANLKSGGKEVVWKAECTFSFSGSAGNTAVNGSEKVTLTAATKLVDKGQHSVLVDGDSKTGGDAAPAFDNRLSVSASGPLKTG